MMLITGMLISGKMSIPMFSNAKGVARTMSIAITMKVYGRRSAISTIDMDAILSTGCPGFELMCVDICQRTRTKAVESAVYRARCRSPAFCARHAGSAPTAAAPRRRLREDARHAGMRSVAAHPRHRRAVHAQFRLELQRPRDIDCAAVRNIHASARRRLGDVELRVPHAHVI